MEMKLGSRLGMALDSGLYVIRGALRSSKEGWRSILYGKKVLDAGLGLRVGIGRHIHIFHDSHSSSSKSTLIRPLFTGLIYFYQLIDWDTRAWNYDLIRNHFSGEDAAISSLADSPPSISIQSWSQLWKHHVPNKLNFFIRRALQDSLATGMNIHKKISDHNPQYKLFGDPYETEMHLFTSCNRARQARFIYMGIRTNAILRSSSSKRWHNLLKELSKSVVPIVSRAKARFLCLMIRTGLLMKLLKKTDEQESENLSLLDVQTQQRGMQNPCPSQPGAIKINFDGSFNHTTNSGGLGVVFSNSARSLLGAKLRSIFTACS
ncbi:unnamed protein product [Dovyalis caffra]|uniref:Reverse transcriptase zinc-binding domain-containing protein n=1 Tax=Dovyalis caffra TaxID=77055 RepID=A0AAV1SEY3_9ROSI|nr:unnamed protein product [Dovyalis caffra]